MTKSLRSSWIIIKKDTLSFWMSPNLNMISRSLTSKWWLQYSGWKLKKKEKLFDFCKSRYSKIFEVTELKYDINDSKWWMQQAD